MRAIVAALLTACVLSSGSVAAGEEPAPQKYPLKDGSTLYIQPDGTMRMVDAQGKPMSMADGVEMALADGRMIMMKNNYVWITVGPPGKAVTVRKEN